MMEIKKWFSFGTIRATADLVDLRAVDADAVELAPGCVVHRKGFNRYEFIASGESVEVDLTLGPGEEFEPAYDLPPRGARRDEFSVIHVGEGDGWDMTRPCMGSIVCGGGLFYLVDAGPHITRSLDALGIGPAEVEGIFHTHAHDDHFAGLTSLVRSDRRLKYYAVPYVRASVQKKLAALMRDRRGPLLPVLRRPRPRSRRMEPGRRARGEAGVLAAPGGDDGVLLPRGHGAARRTYAHLADIASFDVLAQLAAPAAGRASAMDQSHRESFIRELTNPIDLKKIDVGGGLIHGNADDFRADASTRILLSHGLPESRRDHSARITTVAFGESDVLIPGGEKEYFERTALACLVSLFPRCPGPRSSSSPAARQWNPRTGDPVYSPALRDHDVRLIVSGVAEEVDPSSGKRAGSASAPSREDSPAGCAHPPSLPRTKRGHRRVHPRVAPTRTSCPATAVRAAAGSCHEFHEVLSICAAFSGIATASVLNRIAAAMEERHLRAGSPSRRRSQPDALRSGHGRAGHRGGLAAHRGPRAPADSGARSGS